MATMPAVSRVYDISMPIAPEMPVYKDRSEKRPAITLTRDFDPAGGGLRESRISLDLHTGTHLDAPRHALPDGAGVERTPPEQLLGPCRVLDLTEVPAGISPADLEPHGIRTGEFVLLKTRNSLQAGFNPGFVYLTAAAAQYLVRAGVRGVGIDALGVERDQQGHPTHRTLLAAGVAVLEGLRLAEVPAGAYFLVAAPLLIPGADAAPARVLLLRFR